MDRVQSGGLWNSASANYSSQTHQLLKEMMQESRLTNLQMRRVSEAMRNGSSLPQDLPPTSSAKKKPPKSRAAAATAPKVLNPKNYQSSLRSREQIAASGAYQQTQYRPSPSPQRNAEKEKRRLANLMAFGEEAPSDEVKVKSKVGQRRMTLEPQVPEPEQDRFDELAAEIADRRSFLDQMEALGQGQKYRPKIQAEISQMVREMELIDRERNLRLEKMLKEQQSGTDG